MKNNAKKVLILLSAIIAFSGCQQQQLQVAKNKVHVVDEIKAYPFEITVLNTRVNSGGFLEVQVEGENTKSGYKTLEYMVNWYDKDEFKINGFKDNIWTQFPVFRNQTFTFRTISPNTKAVDVKVFIRDANFNSYNIYDSKGVN